MKATFYYVGSAGWGSGCGLVCGNGCVRGFPVYGYNLLIQMPKVGSDFRLSPEYRQAGKRGVARRRTGLSAGATAHRASRKLAYPFCAVAPDEYPVRQGRPLALARRVRRRFRRFPKGERKALWSHPQVRFLSPRQTKIDISIKPPIKTKKQKEKPLFQETPQKAQVVRGGASTPYQTMFPVVSSRTDKNIAYSRFSSGASMCRWPKYHRL